MISANFKIRINCSKIFIEEKLEKIVSKENARFIFADIVLDTQSTLWIKETGRRYEISYTRPLKADMYRINLFDYMLRFSILEENSNAIVSGRIFIKPFILATILFINFGLLFSFYINRFNLKIGNFIFLLIPIFCIIYLAKQYSRFKNQMINFFKILVSEEK